MKINSKSPLLYCVLIATALFVADYHDIKDAYRFWGDLRRANLGSSVNERPVPATEHTPIFSFARLASKSVNIRQATFPMGSSSAPTRRVNVSSAASDGLRSVVSPAVVMAQPRTVPNNRPAPDYWHTQSSMMLNSSNQQVRIQGINWYGFETATQVVHGLDRQDYRTILDRVQEMGFNTLRLPFSNQMVESPIIPSTVSFEHDGHAINSDLRGLNSIQVLDRVIAYAGSIGLRIILDNHRSEAGDGATANGLWYTAAYPESSWIADWQALAMRYAGNATVIGMDIRNEPHLANKGGACWDCGSKAKDWHLAAERAGNAILAINPELLIFVEGTDVYNNDYYWWGGNLEGVRTSPVVLNVPHQLVYSAHDYGTTEYAQPWFNRNTTYASLERVWAKHWAFIAREHIAPVWLGEFGTNADALDAQDLTAGSQGQWFSSMVRFLGENPDIHWTYWALNGEDRYGLLNAGYESGSSSPLKQTLLSGIQMRSRQQVAQTSSAHYLTGGE